MPTLPALIELSSLGSLGFSVQGAPGDRTGFSVSTAGDVNGDGFDDYLVSTPYDDAGGPNAGKVYLLFGKASGFANIDLTTLAPADGFSIQGDYDFDRAGLSVSSAGDVNGDGYDDFLIGAPSADDGGEFNVGKTYVIFGKASGFANIDLAALASADGFVITGDSQQDGSGGKVSSAGDVNDDGYDDIVIGATGGDDGVTDAGEAYVIFGKGSGFTDINLGALDPADGFEIVGAATSDQVGISVSSAGTSTMTAMTRS